MIMLEKEIAAKEEEAVAKLESELNAIGFGPDILNGVSDPQTAALIAQTAEFIARLIEDTKKSAAKHKRAASYEREFIASWFDD
jgi:hypothetical protein